MQVGVPTFAGFNYAFLVFTLLNFLYAAHTTTTTTPPTTCQHLFTIICNCAHRVNGNRLQNNHVPVCNNPPLYNNHVPLCNKPSCTDAKSSLEALIERVRTQQQQQAMVDDRGEVQVGELVIDGKTLSYVLGSDLEEWLAEIGAACGSVVICRASPSQKAAIVRMMMQFELRMAEGAWCVLCGGACGKEHGGCVCREGQDDCCMRHKTCVVYGKDKLFVVVCGKEQGG